MEHRPARRRLRRSPTHRALPAPHSASLCGHAPFHIQEGTSIIKTQLDAAVVAADPIRGIQSKPLNNARERFLSAEEAGRLREAVAASKNPQLQHIVGLLLLTGARVRELLDARWENVAMERQAWLIPTSKTGKARYVPLSQAALDIIAALPRFDGCPWLVPNIETRKPFVSIKHGWQAAREAAGLEGLRIHDLRHSAASFMVSLGVDLLAVGKVLGHASYQSTQRYAHLANDTLLAAVEAGTAKQVQPATA